MTNEPTTLSAQTDTCSSRRGVLKGATALALATAALRMRSVLAEDGTPIATPAGDEHSGSASWLFTQTFREGDWEKTETEGSFTLHLRGGLASTVGFTDRPHRDVKLVTTTDLNARLWSDPTNPPNAAIIVEDAGTQYTFLLVLTEPVYDDAADQITYTVSVLNSYTGDGLGAAVERVADGALPQTFGAGALFIDSLCWGCCDKEKYCGRYFTCDSGTNKPGNAYRSGEILAESMTVTNTCWDSGGCDWPCPVGTTQYADWCNATYPEWCYAFHPDGCFFAVKLSSTRDQDCSGGSMG